MTTRNGAHSRGCSNARVTTSGFYGGRRFPESLPTTMALRVERSPSRKEHSRKCAGPRVAACPEQYARGRPTIIWGRHENHPSQR